jgi:hypothetical protein
MPIKNKYSKKNKIAYSRFDTNPRTKKVQTGGGFLWITYNEEEIARYLAHSAIQTILPTQASLTGKSKSFYIASQQRLHDYIAAMLLRLYKLHKNESFKISSSSIGGLSVMGKIKQIFNIPVKSTGKEDYGRKLYERTNTSKNIAKSGISTDLLRVNDFVSLLNKSEFNKIDTHENIKDRICQNYSVQSSEIQLSKYIEPIKYKIEQNSSTVYTLFGVCNNNQLTYKTIPNIIYKYKTAVNNILAILNKQIRDKAQIKQVKQNYETIVADIKNRVYLEDMATALFYFAMYKNSGSTQSSRTGGYSGYGYGGGYGYRGW